MPGGARVIGPRGALLQGRRGQRGVRGGRGGGMPADGKGEGSGYWGKKGEGEEY